MAEFLEERIAAEIAYGSSYSDEYSVQITRTAGGGEYRSLVHPYPVRRFHLIVRTDLSKAGDKILNLYHRARGSYAGFRVRAVDDFTTASDGRSPPGMLDQVITRISSGLYQLRKRYGTDKTGLTIGWPERVIYKPVAGTLVVAVNGVLKASGVTLDSTTGRVTIAAAPLITDVVTAGCQFDIPVRFDTTIVVDQSAPASRRIDDVELVELLNP